MTKWIRYAAVAALLFFSYNGVNFQMLWPRPTPAPVPTPVAPVLAPQVAAVAKTMLPTDRKYLADFYDCMQFILKRDFARSDKLITNTDAFVAFHASSLRSAIDRGAVGKYPDLGPTIDATIVSFVGADPKEVDEKTGSNLVAACSAIAAALRVGSDE